MPLPIHFILSGTFSLFRVPAVEFLMRKDFLNYAKFEVFSFALEAGKP